MRKRWLAVLALAAALGLLTPALVADNGNGKGKGNPQSNGASARHDPHDRGDRDDRWERRDGFEYRIFEGDHRPPGWSRGRKTGWGNCGMPPGQAKKYGCRGYAYRGRTYYWYRDDIGRMVVRRPILSIRGGVDID